MKTFSFFCGILFLSLFPQGINAQKNTSIVEKKFTVAQLQEDFKVLRRNLEHYHPNLYEYTSKEDLNLAFEKIEQALDHPMTANEFLRLTMTLQKPIGNGHTQMVPADDYYKTLKTDLKRFPLNVYWDKGQLYLLRNLSNEAEIPQGVIIKSINGESAQEVFQNLTESMTRDGQNTSLPEAVISNGFMFFYNIIKGHPDQYTIETQEKDGAAIKTWTFDALLSTDMKKNREERYGVTPPSWHELKQPGATFKIDGNIATLKIRTFEKAYLRKHGTRTKKHFKTIFKQMENEGVAHLIIDLRDNGGGDPEPTIHLFSHLYDQPSTFYKEITSKVKKFPKQENYTNLGFLEKRLYPIIFKNKKTGDTYQSKKIIAGLKPYQPAKTQFKGQVYVLTNPNSFSATGEMTGILKNQGKAIFIGEEPGGNPVQNVSGIMAILELPNTKNRAVIPFWNWVMNVNFKNNGRGVIPDHPVRPSIQDKIDGTDRVMEYTLDLIKGKNN